MIFTTHYASPLGDVLLAAEKDALIGLWLEGQKYFLGTVKEEQKEEEIPVLKEAKRWLDAYFTGNRPEISALNLAPRGSAFQKTVWKLLCEIPYGEVTTYKAVAEKTARALGRPSMSAQAVGGAVGHNPISIIIPCHRVVGADGSLTGYAGGLEKKIRLLTLEGVDMGRFFLPKSSTAP